MDRTGLLGVSWRHATSDVIARLTLPREERAQHLRALADVLEVDELVHLATCNRAEFVYSGGARLSPQERRRRLIAHLRGEERDATDARAVRAWDGEGVVEHLFLVAAGLDSARIGESEVTGQLRVAAQEASDAGLLGRTLRALVDDALRVAKQVRPITEGRIGRTSMSDIATEAVQSHGRDALSLMDSSAVRRRVALVGISPMTEQCAASLARLGYELLFVNRTLSRAEQAAAAVGARAMALDAFRDSPAAVDAVILATAARAPVLDASSLSRLFDASPAGALPLLVDLGAPPNVDAAAARDLGFPLLDLDAITERAEGSRERARTELAEARALVDAALDARRRRAWEQAVDPAIVELRRRLEARARDEVDRVLEDELASLDAAERVALRQWAANLARRLAHVPTRGLRDLAGHLGPDAAAAFLGTAAPDLASQLRQRSRNAPDAAFEESA